MSRHDDLEKLKKDISKEDKELIKEEKYLKKYYSNIPSLDKMPFMFPIYGFLFLLFLLLLTGTHVPNNRVELYEQCINSENLSQEEIDECIFYKEQRLKKAWFLAFTVFFLVLFVFEFYKFLKM